MYRLAWQAPPSFLVFIERARGTREEEAPSLFLSFCARVSSKFLLSPEKNGYTGYSTKYAQGFQCNFS